MLTAAMTATDVAGERQLATRSVRLRSKIYESKSLIYCDPPTVLFSGGPRR